MACPSCFGLMFVGTQFCGHCGAKAAAVLVKDVDESSECPRCRLRLEKLQIGDAILCQCLKCDGFWADVETFENVCADREKHSAVLGFIATRERAANPLSKISYVPCPTCKQLMNRSNFARASGVIIDICKQHGVWFDADELPKIIEFIQKGGMEIARQREKVNIHDQREKLRAEKRRQAAKASRSGAGNIFDNNRESGIREFLQSLFG